MKSLDSLDLQSCLLRDRPMLRRDMEAARARAQAGQPFDKLWSRIEQRFTASARAVALRRSAVPHISYPAELPISAHIALLRDTIAAHQVVVLAGETGSGKTTQLPKLCLEIGRGVTGMIGHTQPRRLAARTVAARVASELGVTPGQEVGFVVRFSENVGERTLVKLMTDGILLNDIVRDPELLAYDTLILDEAHERSLNIDFLIGYLKLLLPRRPDLKLIITSATIDVARFAAHFNNAPVIEISGRGFPVDIVYVPPESDDGEEPLGLVPRVAEIYTRIVEDERRHGGARGAPDVLVFLASEREILELAQGLRRAQLLEDPDILPLYARLPASEQDRVFNPGVKRRIVLATNVAETSLTVPRIGYVIDPGVARISRYSYRSKLQRLPIEPIAKASAAQRSGRCGRIAPGVCFRLYSEEDFLSRLDYTDAEILRTNLASVVLQMKLLGLGEVADFPFLDPPEPRAVNDALTLLGELGAVERGELTPSGKRMARLPIDPRLARMVLAAVELNCTAEVLIIASALAVQDPRERPLDKQQAADASHREWIDPDSDFLSFLHLWVWYEAHRETLSRNQLRKLCAQRHLSAMRLQEWRDLHRQLTLALVEQGVRAGQCGELPQVRDRVHQALLTGSLSLVGMRGERFDYLGARGQYFFLFPGSALFKRRPPWVMAAEIVETGRVYARTLAAIDPAWLEHAASALLKRQYSEPHWSRKRGEVVAFERITLYGLSVVERRRVGYGRIDPGLAREIMLREALVAGDVDRPPRFLQRNLQLVAAIRDDEARLRRRDLLVDEQALFAFYDERVPEDIVDLRSLERWRRAIEATQPDYLLLTRELLLTRPVAVDEEDFPQRLPLDGIEFAVKYRFAPGEPDDGVALQVPIGLLPHLRAPLLEWLVPGYLEPLCDAMIRDLPRALRRLLVPVPEVVREVMDSLRAASIAGQIPLASALSDALRRRRSVDVPLSAWQFDALPLHLRMLIEVRGERGELLQRGRNLGALHAQFRLGGERDSVAQLRGEFERAAITTFPDEGVPPRHVVAAGDRSAVAFPALVAEQDSISLRLLDDAEVAAILHGTAVVILAWRQLGKIGKQMLHGFPQYATAALRYAAFGEAGEFDRHLMSAVVQCVLGAAPATVRDAAAFHSLTGQLRRNGATIVAAIGAQMAEVIAERAVLVAALQSQSSPAFVLAVKDITAQAQWLVPADFVTRHGAQRLTDIARYLRAARLRITNLQGKVERDRAAMQAIIDLEERTNALAKRNYDGARVSTLRWALQELRVLDLSPGVKAALKTSITRVRREIEGCELG